jgi:hypothetical protein
MAKRECGAGKHSPGPWMVEMPLEMEMDARPCVCAHGGKTPVAEILQPLTDEDGPCRGEYDCRLIAAAPDLLAACENAYEAVQNILPAHKRGGCLNVLDADKGMGCGYCTPCVLENAITKAKEREAV